LTVPVPKPASNPPLPAPISLLTEVLVIIGVTCVLLVPCIWQQHIEAGDLASHVYNAWLVAQVKTGVVQGLYLTHPLTNVLCDRILEWLLVRVGPAWAERMLAGTGVLVFFWGAFYLVNVVTLRRPWLLAPAFAMLAYGLVFNLGFVNFYVSTGISLWITGLLWQPTRNRVILSLPLWVLAILAHVMPVAWAAFVLVYTHLLRRFTLKMRAGALAASFIALIGMQLLVMKLFAYQWSLDQSLSLAGVLGVTGAEQVFLSGTKYFIVVAGAMAIGCVMFLERIDQGGMLNDPMVHIWILQMAAYVLTPAAVQLPQYQHVFAYIPQRVSLFNALIFCVMIGGGRYGRGITRLTALLAGVYFTFFFLDSRSFNDIESQVKALIDSAPQGARVVAEIADSNSRLNPLLHIADRSCIGRCFSYANYEPATGQFRLRAAGPNLVVAPTMDVVKEIEDGRHIVTKAEAPVYSVCKSDRAMLLRRLEAGETTCSFSLPVSPAFWLSSGDQSQVPDH
jgi:hypothetical protein